MLNNSRYPKKSNDGKLLQKRSRTQNAGEVNGKDYELKQNYQFHDKAENYFANVSGTKAAKLAEKSPSQDMVQQQQQFQQQPLSTFAATTLPASQPMYTQPMTNAFGAATMPFPGQSIMTPQQMMPQVPQFNGITGSINGQIAEMQAKMNMLT